MVGVLLWGFVFTSALTLIFFVASVKYSHKTLSFFFYYYLHGIWQMPYSDLGSPSSTEYASCISQEQSSALN